MTSSATQAAVDVSKCKALAELHSLIGLDHVKRKVDELVVQQAAGLPVQDVRGHKVFLGNPGIARPLLWQYLNMI